MRPFPVFALVPIVLHQFLMVETGLNLISRDFQTKKNICKNFKNCKKIAKIAKLGNVLQTMRKQMGVKSRRKTLDLQY